MENNEKQTVLIVDDIKENIHVLNGILKQDYIIKVATSGEMALKVALKTMPDIILLDIMMPEMDGYTVCKKLKENPLTQYIPVVFVTAMDDDVDEAYGLEVGAVDYITKPVSPIIVKSRVKIHLALSDHERELDRKVREKTALINKTRLDIIEILGRAAEYKDNETGNHIIRMSQYSYLIALSHGMDKRDAELLRNAAPMHDVGKIGIPDKILLKAGPLDDEEWQIMRTHSQMGAIIIGDHDSKLLITACIIAKEHHERWDGNGYPKGLKERDIDLYARIVAIADVFDALTSKRPYKEPWSSERAFDYIVNEKGKHFDPELVDAFENSIDEILKIKDALAD